MKIHLSGIFPGVQKSSMYFQQFPGFPGALANLIKNGQILGKKTRCFKPNIHLKTNRTPQSAWLKRIFQNLDNVRTLPIYKKVANKFFRT